MHCDAQQQRSSSHILAKLLSSFSSLLVSKLSIMFIEIFLFCVFKSNPIWIVLINFFHFSFHFLVVYIKCSIQFCPAVPSALWWSVSPCTKSKYAWARLKLTEARIRNTLRGFAPYLAAGKPWTLSNPATTIEFLKWFCSKVLCYGRVLGQRAGFAQIGWFHQTKVTYWLGKMGEMNI